MIVVLVISFMLSGQHVQRHESMPNLSACWRQASERMQEIRAAHPEITQIGIGCAVNDGDPI